MYYFAHIVAFYKGRDDAAFRKYFRSILDENELYTMHVEGYI